MFCGVTMHATHAGAGPSTPSRELKRSSVLPGFKSFKTPDSPLDASPPADVPKTLARLPGAPSAEVFVWGGCGSFLSTGVMVDDKCSNRLNGDCGACILAFSASVGSPKGVRVKARFSTVYIRVEARKACEKST